MEESSLEKKLYNLKNLFSEMFVQTSCKKCLPALKKYYTLRSKLFDWNSCLPVF